MEFPHLTPPTVAKQSLMKDGLGLAAVRRISDGLLAAGAQFDTQQFQHEALTGIESLELKQRVQHLVKVMANYLPRDFEQTAIILGQIRNHWDEGNPNDNLRSFAAWPIIDYVADYGINTPETSLRLLRYLTPMYSAEFAIRTFLIRHPELTYHEMMLWCLDPDEHVRRLASEGIRPRLPWGFQLKQYIRHPEPVIALLDNLIDDPSDYVRRSVANNLNDISKDHPDLVIETCQRWLAKDVPARQWIVRHGTRTLVKAGHPAVFPLLGYSRNPRLKLSAVHLTPSQIQLGEAINISIEVTAEHEQRIVIDYAIHFVKASGQTAPKVFKWKNLHLKAGETIVLSKKHPIKAISTRKYYPGKQYLEILVNGQTKANASFGLQLPE